MARKGWQVDLSKCIGCHGCTIACKAGNCDCEMLRIFRRFTVGIPSPVLAEYYVTMSCNQCEDPSCVAACPKGALHKDPETGIVMHDPDRCVGCRRCEWACPYGAVQFCSDTGRVTKCQMCYDRQEVGLEPQCVATCAMSAITVVDDFDIAESGLNAPACFADPALTRPAIKFINPYLP